MTDTPKCELCGEPMPEGESMFKYHGYSGSCPKPPLPEQGEEVVDESIYADLQEDNFALCEALRAVLALVGEDQQVAKIINDALEGHEE